MPRTSITVTQIPSGGVGVVPTETAGDAANNMIVTNDDQTTHCVRNSGGTTRNVTPVAAAGGPDGLAVTNPTFTLAAGATKYFKLPVAIYNQSGSDVGRAYINVDHADVQFSAIRR